MTGLFRQARIDASAITENVKQLRTLVDTELIAVVKADGYGHGAVTAGVAALAGGANRLGAADISEALKLREAGVTAPVMAWLHAPGEDFEEALAQGLEIGISRFEQLAAVVSAARGKRIAEVHLKLDTGLSRNGIAPDDWPRVFAEVARLERMGALKVIGIMTHLSLTSPLDDDLQFARYQEGVQLAADFGIVPVIRHVAATEAALTRPEMRLDSVRVGLGIYGLSPIAGRTSASWGLRPAMELRSQVAAVRRVPAGAGASYGFDFRAPVETTLALVPMGYADGIPRHASARGAEVTIRGVRMPVAGRVAMDQIVIDAGDHPVAVGDEVVIFGDPEQGVPSADDWAAAAGTINYEIVTRVGPRVPRTNSD
jgi:alanine racemase